MNRFFQRGFTLVEIAIVLLIVTILLGYTMAMVPIQQELKQYKQADAEMNKITEAIYAFGQVNGYLPCPAWADDLAAPTDTSNGFECRDINANGAELCKDGAITTPDPTVDSCDVWYGFVPGKTLGIEGRYSIATGLLLDPWGMPYRYQVTNDDADTAGTGLTGEDFITQNEMRAEGMNNLGPDLNVCNADPTPAAAGSDISCGGATNTIIATAPVVILSTGKDRVVTAAGTNSWAQKENLDNTGVDTVFVKTTKSDNTNAEFDDLVKWISPNILYSKMIEAGQLP
jgi:prepilin-type N-terminal cleavage/methylation domain-containing protein